MLQSQVFPIISGLAGGKHIKKILKALIRHLKVKDAFCFRLNTDFEELKLDLGRAFGFAYGEKENGSVFSHMNVLLAYGLYKAGFPKEADEIIRALFKLSTAKEAMILPCIPEYFNLKNQGCYPYLTGSASWLIYSLAEQRP